MVAAMAPALAQTTAGEAAPQFNPHFYLQLQGGAQYTVGESSLGKLISPNVQAAIGRQFNPWLGARLSVNAWQSRGGYNGYRQTGNQARANYKWKYVAPSLDFMFNLSQLLGGYNPDRVVNVSAFLGAGANYAGGNQEAVAIAAQGHRMSYLWTGKKLRATGRGGVAVDFRLSDAVSLGVEANANIINDRYNSKKADNADWYFNALAGVRINLGKTRRTAARQDEPVTLPLAGEERPVVVEQPAAPAPAEQKREKESIRRDVHFQISSSEVDAEGMAKIAELADFMKRHKGSTLDIEGYADVQTGSAKYNKWISEQRAKAVFNVLTKKHGIEPHRITYTFKGDTVQPFRQNDANRVSICIATEE